MNQKQRTALNKILNDKTSGSSELLFKINQLLFDSLPDINTINEIVRKINKELSHFTILDNYFRELKRVLNKNDKKLLEKFIISNSNDHDKYKIIAGKFQKAIQRYKNIITISRSGTFLNVITLADTKRKIEITVLESRPENEGRLTAKELLIKGFKVKVITDAMMAFAVKNTDAVIVGADSILKNGNVVNKSGSLPLAILCKKYRKPFYVVATKLKFTSKRYFKPVKEKPEVIWDYKNRKLTVENFPFEEIDKSLITSIITE